MRNLRRNESLVYYKMYLGKEELIDEYGNMTGSYRLIHGELQSSKLCVSPNKGTSETEQFGSIENYDRIMTTADIHCPIDEDSILWLDGADTSKQHNYIVKKRAPWKNSISYAIQQVRDAK